ncbi:MAG: poly(beta-D-mannuronate) lyase [Colwellia sp.]|jgi:poly(beta-D-mannuronate) lyase
MYSIKTQQYIKVITYSLFPVVLALLLSGQVTAKDWIVDTPKAYKKVLKKVNAGDNIVLANGTWNNFEILFKAEGTKQEPITLKAQTKGKVFLTGQSNLRLAGKYLVVSGLVFKNGYTPSSEVISFRQNKNELAFNSRVTEVVIDNFSNPDRFESDYWVGIYGQYNRFDHNHLVGKRNKGVTVAVRLTTEDSQENHHRIDHNYFGPRPIFGSNGGETLRIGTSHHSLTNSFTTVENNYFDRCNGEVEIVSVKSGKNKIVNNTFFESRGTLTLRHGNGNLIENNVFFGNGVDHTGGIRVINRDQIVRNNYLEGLTGYRFGSGLTIMNGVPNSSINRYHQVVNAQIENNTLINIDHVHLAAGSDAERSAVPKNSVIKDNLFFNDTGKAPFSVFDDISGITFSNNTSNKLTDNKIASGITEKNLVLQRADNGLLYPISDNDGIGVSKNLQPTQKNQTGTTWYAKAEPDVPFESGKTTTVKAGGESLYKAIKQANSGDILVLDDGNYSIDKIVKLDKTVSINAKNRHQVTLEFGRSTLFEINNGGSLSIDGVVVSGKSSADYSGNTFVRTAKWGMFKNYRFAMKNSVIKDLNVNHSFHFLDSGSRAFAQSIDVENNVFENITGDIFRLNKEIDDLGIYNVEYLNVINNTFNNVEGMLVNLYRGGSDESTFGPHLLLKDNTVNNVGNGKRNKSKSAIILHGVQVSTIDSNTFVKSGLINIEHTVGEPKTVVKNNTFNKTAAPSVKELHAKGPHTAVLLNNKQF